MPQNNSTKGLSGAVALRANLVMYAATGLIAGRDFTGRSMLQAATTFTHIKYKRREHAKAAADLKKWIDTVSAALSAVRA